jgi:hypothetical protein
MKRRTLLLAGTGAIATAAAGAVGWRGATGSADDYTAAMRALRRPFDPVAGSAEWLRFATLAANGHNTQPWRFRIDGDALWLLPDTSRRTPVVDPADHHLWASLGCAAANLRIAAAAAGRHGEVVHVEADGGALRFEHAAGPAEGSPLLDAIPQRQSTRGDYDGRGVSAADVQALLAAAQLPGVATIVLTQRREIDRVRDLVIEGNRVQMGDPAFVAELRDWIRFSPRAALARGDGLYSASSGNPTLPDPIGRRLFERVFTVAAETARYARHLDTAAGVAIFLAERDDPAHWALAGAACQRFGLMACALGLRTAFVNQPAEVPSLRGELAALAGLPGRRPDIVMRFGHGPLLPYSPRRPPPLV